MLNHIHNNHLHNRWWCATSGWRVEAWTDKQVSHAHGLREATIQKGYEAESNVIDITFPHKSYGKNNFIHKNNADLQCW